MTRTRLFRGSVLAVMASIAMGMLGVTGCALGSSAEKSRDSTSGAEDVGTFVQEEGLPPPDKALPPLQQRPPASELPSGTGESGTSSMPFPTELADAGAPTPAGTAKVTIIED